MKLNAERIANLIVAVADVICIAIFVWFAISYIEVVSGNIAGITPSAWNVFARFAE